MSEFINSLGLIFTNPYQLIQEGKIYVLLLPAYLFLLGGERLAYFFLKNKEWNNYDAAANLFITGLMFLIDMFVGFLLPLAILIFLYDNYRLFTIPETWWGWLTCFLLYDLTWYVNHRIGHRTGLFWAFHQVHHSSEDYNTTVASRGFIFDSFLTRPLFYLLPVIGVAPLVFVTVKVLTNIWGIAQHTRLIGKLGILDWLFATPSSHRVHHGSDEKYLDKNYGEMLLAWDHLFRTFEPEGQEPKYGLTKNINTYNPFKIEISGIRLLCKKMQSCNGLKSKLACLYKPPAWEPGDFSA